MALDLECESFAGEVFVTLFLPAFLALLAGDMLSSGVSFSLSCVASVGEGLLDGYGAARALKRPMDPGDLVAGIAISQFVLLNPAREDERLAASQLTRFEVKGFDDVMCLRRRVHH